MEFNLVKAKKLEELDKYLTISNQLITLLIAFSALLISLIQLRRSRRQANEDIIYQTKLQAYREIIKRTYDFVAESYLFIQEFQDFQEDEGTQEEWSKVKMPELFRIYYPKVEEIEAGFSEYSVFLPNDFIEQFEDFTLRSTSLIVEGHHFDMESTLESYDLLTEVHNTLLTIARKDLSVDVLNTKLNYRLGQ